MMMEIILCGVICFFSGVIITVAIFNLIGTRGSNTLTEKIIEHNKPMEWPVVDERTIETLVIKKQIGGIEQMNLSIENLSKIVIKDFAKELAQSLFDKKLIKFFFQRKEYNDSIEFKAEIDIIVPSNNDKSDKSDIPWQAHQIHPLMTENDING